MAEPRYSTGLDGTVCLDCGVVVSITEAHTRFHSILSAHAWALAILENSHITEEIHDRYNVKERIRSKHFDSWSNDALMEVFKKLAPAMRDVFKEELRNGPGTDRSESDPDGTQNTSD